MLKLLVEDLEGNSSNVFPIEPDKSDVTIGRKPDNQICLNEQNVSRHHARIFMRDGQLYIATVKARFGLKVNSTKITDGNELPINLADEIHIGDFRLFVQDESTPDIRQQQEAQTEEVQPLPMDMQPRLVVVSSNYAGTEYRLTETRVVIGRDPKKGCGILITHASISGRHAEIHRDSRGNFIITDLKSSNGTVVNGQLINGPVMLNSGDFIMLGHVCMRFCAPGDLWSLNFGHTPQKGVSLPLILIFVLLALVVGATFTYIFIKKSITPPQDNTEAINAKQQELDAAKQSSEVLQLVIGARKDMEDGNFEAAQEKLETAENLSPNEKMVHELSDKLDKETKSKRALENVQHYLDAKNCRDAISELEVISRNTWAYEQMDTRNLKRKANDCLEENFLTRAMDAIEKGDFSDAEIARDEIARVNPNSSNISKINEAIRAKRPSHRGGGSPTADSGQPSGAPAAPAAPAVDKKSQLSELVAQMEQASGAPNKGPIAKKILKVDSGHVDALCWAGAYERFTQKNDCAAYKHFKKVIDKNGNCSFDWYKKFVVDKAADCGE